jgi:hypothetical protein
MAKFARFIALPLFTPVSGTAHFKSWPKLEKIEKFVSKNPAESTDHLIASGASVKLTVCFGFHCPQTLSNKLNPRK